jgi:hypothetical protein
MGDVVECLIRFYREHGGGDYIKAHVRYKDIVNNLECEVIVLNKNMHSVAIKYIHSNRGYQDTRHRYIFLIGILANNMRDAFAVDINSGGTTFIPKKVLRKFMHISN